jgi:hypothetical protein
MKYFIVKVGKQSQSLENLNEMDIAHAITILFRLLEGWKEFSVHREPDGTSFRFVFEKSLPKRKDWLCRRVVGEFGFYELGQPKCGSGTTVIAAERDIEP